MAIQEKETETTADRGGDCHCVKIFLLFFVQNSSFFFPFSAKFPPFSCCPENPGKISFLPDQQNYKE